MLKVALALPAARMVQRATGLHEQQAWQQRPAVAA